MADSLPAADSNPKDEVKAAATKLAEKPNYSWKTTVVVPESAQFKPGPTEGKVEKDGFMHVSLTFGNNPRHVVKKGEKVVLTNRDGDWQLLSEIDSEGPGRFLRGMAQNAKAPADQARELADAAKELKKEGETIAGDLTDEGAKAQFRFGNVTGAKGSVKFWVKDGILTKYEFKTQGKAEFNGNEVDVDRASTVEIKDVGTTQVNIPEGAKKKLGV
jgi:hypothetical protein